MQEFTGLDFNDSTAVRRGGAIRRRNSHQLSALRSRRGPAGDDERTTREHLVDIEAEIGKGTHVDLHELAAGVATGQRRWNRIALEDVLLVEELKVPFGIMRVPSIEVIRL